MNFCPKFVYHFFQEFKFNYQIRVYIIDQIRQILIFIMKLLKFLTDKKKQNLNSTVKKTMSIQFKKNPFKLITQRIVIF